MTLDEAINLGNKHHQAGRLAEAEALYRQVLSQQPENPEALHLLGVIAYQVGKYEAAEDLIGRALAIQPGGEFRGNYGLALAARGKIDAAIAEFQRSLAIHPDQPRMVWNLGNALGDKGQFKESIAAFRRALKMQPQFPEALHNLARVLLRDGQLSEAILVYQHAVRQAPGNVDAVFELGNALHGAGAMDGAIAAYRRAVSLKPTHQQAMNNLGNVLCSLGRMEEAIAEYQRALKLGAQPAALNNLGNALCAVDRVDEAIESFRQALALQPEAAGILGNLATAVLKKGDAAEAIRLFEQSLAKAPGSALVRHNLAEALEQRGDHDGAIAHCRLALAASPKFVEAIITLGNALAAKGEDDPAMEAYRSALSIDPGNRRVHNNIGNILHGRGRHREAIEEYRQAIKADENLAIAHWNLGLMLLTCGELEEGWKEYHWRWDVKEHGSRTVHKVPWWDGGDLAGRRILLYAEQGFGDAIQFARYVPMVAERGGRIILGCQRELQGVLRNMAGAEAIEAWVFQDEICPDYDVHCALMSLPMVFGTTLANVPANVPYLSAEPGRVEKWKARLEGEGRKKIGLAWAGAAGHASDRRRSFSVGTYGPLGEVAGARFISLQKGPAGEEAKNEPFEVADWTAELDDFADTAALIANLDLVITADTAVGHLAGAMGKPVWVMVPLVADWRWMVDRTDSPWYPTMRLFRQTAKGDWGAVVEEVKRVLSAECGVLSAEC